MVDESPDSAGLPPPGWYPEEGRALRWWDGSGWTDHRAEPTTTPARRRRQTILTALAVVCAVLFMVGSFVAYAYLSGKAEDVLSLDDPAIRSTAAQACAAVTERIEGATGSRSRRIEIGNDAIAQLVADMNAIGTDKLKADKPALDWITDWQLLAGARKTFAALTIGTEGVDAPFSVPTTKGYPITKRMTDVSPEECGRAVALAASP